MVGLSPCFVGAELRAVVQAVRPAQQWVVRSRGRPEVLLTSRLS